MKIKHQAPHLDKVKHLDVADRKAIKSYYATWKRKLRALKRKIA
jgi:hypothetical protein